MTMFDNYLMVDWSASNKPLTGKDSIWLAWLEKVQQIKFFNPDTRIKTLEKITELLNNTKGRTIVGFDFPFGYPADSYGGFKCHDWLELWNLISGKIKDSPYNKNNRFDVGDELNKCFPDNDGPFWGHRTDENYQVKHINLFNKKPQNYNNTLPTEFRIIEKELLKLKSPYIKPKSVWKLFNPPNVKEPIVGSQTLMGIPILNKLRKEFDCAVWPFDLINEDPKKQFVLAEIYPSIWRRQKKYPITDADQVYTVAKNIAYLDETNTLRNLLQAPHRHSRKDDIIKKEGWILGVDENGKPAQCP